MIDGLEEMTMRVGPNALKPPSPAKKRHLRSHASFIGSPRESDSSSMMICGYRFPMPPSSPSPNAANGVSTVDNPNRLTEEYKRITEAYMADALRRTRARGALLPSVQRDDLDASELAWRDENRELLLAIYGREDIVITEVERELVDRIAGEMKEGVGRIAGYEWVRRLFSDFSSQS
jgi:hypothetical protein